jgi:DNA-binding transcriptional LysR family regulator
MNSSWDDYRYVLAVAEAGGLSAGARRLGVSHPTVYRRLRALEARLGVRLFDRLPGGYVPTTAGAEIVREATALAGTVAALERRLAGRDLGPVGVVRLTAPDTLATHLLPEMLEVLRRQSPAIVVELVMSNEFLPLTRREADIALRPTDNPPEHLVGQRIASIGHGAYASAADIDGWIGFDDGLAHLATARWMAAHVAPARITLRVNTLIAMQAAARAGLGIALLPHFMASGLVPMSGPTEPLLTPLWLLTHRDLRRVPRVRAVLDGLAGLFRRLDLSVSGR